MSRGRLSDCSGSTTGKMEVRVLTHSQAVSSACERRESVACARKGSLRLLLCPGARARARGENARGSRARRRRLVFRRGQNRNGSRLRNDRGMPVFTPGSNPGPPRGGGRRESRFLSSSRRDGSDGGGRGGAAADTNAPFLRGRVPRERAELALATSFGICSSEKTVRRRRSTRRGRKNEKRKTPLASTTTAPSASAFVRSGQKRIIGCVMTEECPCSPREATLGASPAARAAGRACIDHPATSAPAFPTFEKQTVAAPFEVHLHFPLRTSRPRRGASLKCSPLSKRAPIAGVLRPLLQVTFCERAARNARRVAGTRRNAANDKKKRKTGAARGPPRRDRPAQFSSVERW